MILISWFTSQMLPRQAVVLPFDPFPHLLAFPVFCTLYTSPSFHLSTSFFVNFR